MLPFLAWYLIITAAGWIAFPLAFRLLRFLPDRGYTLSRALGWLIWGYLFWIGTSLGITANNPGGILLGLLILAAASLIAMGGRSGFAEIRKWIRQERRLVITAEVVFLAGFAMWALVRSFMPEISGTEKPMELAFINGIMASLQFPPHDPWLSGYAISYYYFGYVLVAMLARITATASGTAFNLGISLLFSLTALETYGLVYNLLHNRRSLQPELERSSGLYSLPLLGPLFLLLVSNLEGFLELLHAKGLFWQQNFDGTWNSGFWKWLGILELNQPPALPFTWAPNRPGGVLWWRASRVLADYGYDGSFREVIDEFPFFSYLLGDMHPHVLAMPFALLAAGLALNLYLSHQAGEFKLWRLSIPVSPAYFILSAIVLGGMSFLNTWDFPIYIGLFCGAFVLARVREAGWKWSLAGDFVKLGLVLGITGGLLYLPFYIGFSSQAGGILPSLIFYTRGTQFWIMFAPLLVPVLVWLVFIIRSRQAEYSVGKGFRLAALTIGGLWAASYLFALLITLSDKLGLMFLNNQGMASLQISPLLVEATLARLKAPGAWITLLILIGLALAAIMARSKTIVVDPNTNLVDGKDEAESGIQVRIPGKADVGRIKWMHENGFVLLLVLMGGLLTLIPEFFYLLDQFGGRMNTIFKLYFQAWLVWSIAAAFGTAVLLQSQRRKPGLIFRAGIVILLFMGLVYAPVMLADRTNGFQPPANGLSLDGLASFRMYNPDEAAGIDYLKSAAPGVVAEAVGGQYSAYARVATQTGLANVLGWPGHESQWRGSDAAFNTRFGDIERLYSTNDWAEADAILRQYSIRYIFVGGLERSTYRVNEKKFQDNLVQVFSQGNVTIYEVVGNTRTISETGQEQ